MVNSLISSDANSSTPFYIYIYIYLLRLPHSTSIHFDYFLFVFRSVRLEGVDGRCLKTYIRLFLVPVSALTANSRSGVHPRAEPSACFPLPNNQSSACILSLRDEQPITTQLTLRSHLQLPRGKLPLRALTQTAGIRGKQQLYTF